jgi:hypothetical protein
MPNLPSTLCHSIYLGGHLRRSQVIAMVLSKAYSLFFIVFYVILVIFCKTLSTVRTMTYHQSWFPLGRIDGNLVLLEQGFTLFYFLINRWNDG